jgi:hypothetical protein
MLVSEFNALNWTQVACDLTELQINNVHRKVTLDIKDLCVNISTE